jgi:type I restriction enzyme S subunit
VVPPLEEQREIANVFNALDRKQKVQKQKNVVLNDLFRTLLRQLMTAQIRVHDIDLTELGSAATADEPCQTTRTQLVI